MTSTRAVLADAAFGAHPDRWPLPAAADPYERWLRAVAAGGQGRYAAALSDLTALPGTALASPAMSARASFLRQLGWHRCAAGWDGRALAAAGDGPAVADALTGLAADALGAGRFGASQRLLDRAAAAVETAADARLPIRLDWVRAELAMVQGDGDTAVVHAERAVSAAATHPSARHRVKSDVVLAAALCSCGDLDRARTVADAALAAADRLGLVPLQWALASLLAGVGSVSYTPTQVTAIRGVSADTVRHRGGVWSDR